ncbi:MAG: NmrA family NAD(P)-binding protein [Aureispira sp.]
MKILIMGATGNAGSQAIKALQAKGIRPTAAVRDIDKAKAKLGEDLDYVYFDYSKPETFAPALEGVNKLFFIAPPPDKNPAIVRALTKVIKEKAVDFVLFQSGRSSGGYEGKPLYEIEQFLESSGLNICIYRAAWYMQNFNTWMNTFLAQDEICLPTGEGKVSYIDLEDLGGCIAELLTTNGHGGKRYMITGGEAIDFWKVAECFTEGIGRKITYSNPSDEEYVAKMVLNGFPEKAAKYNLWLYGRVKDGCEEEVTSTTEDLLGRKPKSFLEFAKNEFKI